MQVSNQSLYLFWLYPCRQANNHQMHAAGLAREGLHAWYQPGLREMRTNHALSEPVGAAFKSKSNSLAKLVGLVKKWKKSKKKPFQQTSYFYLPCFTLDKSSSPLAIYCERQGLAIRSRSPPRFPPPLSPLVVLAPLAGRDRPEPLTTNREGGAAPPGTVERGPNPRRRGQIRGGRPIHGGGGAKSTWCDGDGGQIDCGRRKFWVGPCCSRCATSEPRRSSSQGGGPARAGAASLGAGRAVGQS
jgi:hypothetical protein